MDYMKKAKKMLNSWINYSMDELYTIPERPDLLCYGSGYNGWGMQTHQKGFAAFTAAAVNKEIKTDIDKCTLLEYSLKMLRYMLESHIEGGYYCVEGDKWGHTWISVLGTERAMHAVDILMPYMTVNDKQLLKKVLISEADWILEEYPVEAEPYGPTGKNRPESNMWNGAFLHRVSNMYPDCINADRYRKKGNVFLANSISVSADAHSEIIYDGEPLKKLHIGSNFFDSFSLDHHNYLNVGYMVITLSNIAIYHFACKMNNFTPPQALYHHAKELWQHVKSFMFKDGRLIRIGGDTRVRYCYCQDYAAVMLMFAADYLGDRSAVSMLHGIIDMYEREAENNGDGSFLSERCEGFRKISPIYYTRLESDRAAVLSMYICWEKYIGEKNEQTEILHKWHEEYHGACMVRGKRRFASWVASGANGPVGLCLPADKSDLAEWDFNLAGQVRGAGALSKTKCIMHSEQMFGGGFAAFGKFEIHTSHFLAEQQKAEISAITMTACAALPDDASMVVMQLAVSPERIYSETVKGIMYNVPNDIFNGKTRKYYYDGKYHTLEGIKGKEEIIPIKGNYVNIDDILGIYGGYGKGYSIYRPGTRKTGIVVYDHQDKFHESCTYSFYSDSIVKTAEITPSWKNKGETLIDDGAVITVGVNGKQTEISASQNPGIDVTGSGKIRSISVTGRDGNTYTVIANFGEEAEKVRVTGGNFIKLSDEKYFDGKTEGYSVTVLKKE